MKEITHIVNTNNVMVALSKSNDPDCQKAYKAWSNPDQFMDSKIDFVSIVDKGIAKYKSL